MPMYLWRNDNQSTFNIYHTHLNKGNLLIMFNDADGHYDCMRPELCSITLHRSGHPKGVVSSHSHKILTSHGILTELIINPLGLKLVDTGQGRAGSGASWHCHMEPMLQALTQFPYWYQFTDVTHDIHFIQYIIGCIHYSSILCNLPNLWFPSHRDDGPSVLEKALDTRMETYPSPNVYLL